MTGLSVAQHRLIGLLAVVLVCLFVAVLAPEGRRVSVTEKKPEVCRNEWGHRVPCYKGKDE